MSSQGGQNGLKHRHLKQYIVLMENTAPSREELRQRLRFQQMRGKMMRMKSESREVLKEKAIRKAQDAMPPKEEVADPSTHTIHRSDTVPIQGVVVGDSHREMKGPSIQHV